MVVVRSEGTKYPLQPPPDTAFFYEMVRRQGLEISFRRKIVLHLYAFGDSPGFVRVAYLVLTRRTF